MSLTLCAATSARCQLTAVPILPVPSLLAAAGPQLLLRPGRSPCACRVAQTPLLSHRQEVVPAGCGEHSPRLCGVCGSGGGGCWGRDTQRHTSLSLFSSQDLKFNYISKEINFKVTFSARVEYVHCQVCAARSSAGGGFPELGCSRRHLLSVPQLLLPDACLPY